MTTSIFRTLGLSAILAIALIAAGCGGGGDSSSSDSSASGPPLSKEEFISQADAICAQGSKDLQANLQEQFGGSDAPPSQDEQEAFLSGAVADNYEAQAEQLRSLNPPEADADQVDAIFTALDDLASQLRDDPTTVLNATEPPEASQLAQDYGLQQCGN